MPNQTLTIFEPLAYTSRLTFNGREGVLQPYFAKAELDLAIHDRNIPVKSKLAPFLSLVKALNNRFIIWVEDPSLYSGLLEPKNGQSVQEFYAYVKKIAGEDGLWLSLDSQAVQNTLGGVSLAVIKEQPTVENIAYYMTQYIAKKFPTTEIGDYISISIVSNNSPLSGKSSKSYF